jgi:hypothetical protein
MPRLRLKTTNKSAAVRRVAMVVSLMFSHLLERRSGARRTAYRDLPP